MKNLKWISLIILLVFICCTNPKGMQNLMIGERINGPANVRDTINGNKILFSLDDNLIVECTEAVNNWNLIGYYVKLNPVQSLKFKLEPGDTLFDGDGQKVGIIINETNLWMSSKNDSVSYGLIGGYTHSKNIKSESIIENKIEQLVNKSRKSITLDDLSPLIKSFQLETCSPFSMADENGEWYFKWDNSIDDPSPQDRITLIIENKILIGIVHARKIHFEKLKTYKLIRNHEFTPVEKLSESKINEIIKERINWYNSVD